MSTISLIFLVLIVNILSLPQSSAHKNTTSAVFVFGDSTVNSGNNDYSFPTIARRNFPPYGKDFPNHKATGRFSNGRLVTDFTVEFVGLKKNLPPYLDPSLTIDDLITGVNFASAGAGYDELTCQIGGALTQMQQLDMFREYKAKLEVAIGKERTDDLVRRAGYHVSSGTNDFTFNYYGPFLVRRKAYPTVSQYQQFQWQKVEEFLQALMDEGAKKIAVVGVPPMGCLPAIITLNSKKPISGRQCFEESHKGCCGTGLIEADFGCNPKSPLCDDVSKYVFWDAFHPSEKGYHVIFNSIKSVIQNNFA